MKYSFELEHWMPRHHKRKTVVEKVKGDMIENLTGTLVLVVIYALIYFKFGISILQMVYERYFWVWH